MKKLGMMLWLSLLILGVTATAQRHTGRSQAAHDPNEIDGGPPGQFDLYLLTVSWEPGYCATSAGKGTAECKNPPRFALHGLWPENTNGTYPAFCVPAAPGPSDPSVFQDLYPDPSFLLSEWNKHGVCSGTSADTYFTNARQALQSLSLPPTLTGDQVPPSLTPEALLQLFATANPGKPPDAFRLSCGSNHFSAIQMCVDKTMQPVSCAQIKTCGATSVVIDPPTN